MNLTAFEYDGSIALYDKTLLTELCPSCADKLVAELRKRRDAAEKRRTEADEDLHKITQKYVAMSPYEVQP